MIYLVRYHGTDAPPDIAVCEGDPPARYADYIHVTRARWLDAWWERDQWQAYGMRPQTVGTAHGTYTAPLGGDGPPPAVALTPGTVVVGSLSLKKAWG